MRSTRKSLAGSIGGSTWFSVLQSQKIINLEMKRKSCQYTWDSRRACRISVHPCRGTFYCACRSSEFVEGLAGVPVEPQNLLQNASFPARWVRTGCFERPISCYPTSINSYRISLTDIQLPARKNQKASTPNMINSYFNALSTIQKIPNNVHPSLYVL